MTSRLATFRLLLCSIGFAAAACSGPAGETCTVDEDCSSHFCKADGTCGPAPVDGSMDTGDAGVDTPSGLCSPDHDGQITLDELPLVAGRSATFRVAGDATWSTAGTSHANGTHSWDLTSALTGDADRVISLGEPDGTWWRTDYPAATYTAPLAADSDLLGVFKVDASGVVLLGVVSPDAGTYKTNLEYDPPARILAVPFGAGSTWMTTSTVSGYAQGAIVAYTEKYESRADLVGQMKTPYGNFPVIRVATDLTRTSGFSTLLTKRTFAWVAECFGSVATVQSQDFESSTEFSDDAEVRRLVQ
jgi:hypothetical protein